MDTIKKVFKKIGEGFIFGIGAGITAGLIFAFISQMMMQNMWNTEAETIEKVRIFDHREIIRNGMTVILGTAENNSDNSLRSLMIKADLYDTNGTFVKQCTEYLPTLHAKKKSNFEISCKSCDGNKTVQHSSYKIYASGF